MEHQAPTREATAHCSALDAPIRVLVRELDWEQRGNPSPRDAAEAVTCLEYGVRCTGWLCPLFSLPELPLEGLLPEAMEPERARRERAGGSGRPPD